MKKLFIILSALFFVLTAKAQYELQFGQLIKTIEFINPGYNAVQNNISGTLLYKNQWNGFPKSPNTGGASLHMPFSRKHFGAGLLFLSESLGHRDLQTAALSLDADVRIGEEMYLTAGVLAGYQLTDYNIEKGNTAYIETVSDIYNYSAPIAGVGLNFFYKNFHLGGSAYYQISRREPDLYNQMTIYANVSYWAKLNTNWRLKAMGLHKTHGIISSINEAGAFLLFKDWIWLGGSYRLNSSVIIMADIKMTDYLRLGYSYTVDAGKLATFNANSHEIQLHFFIPKKSRNLLSK